MDLVKKYITCKTEEEKMELGEKISLDYGYIISLLYRYLGVMHSRDIENTVYDKAYQSQDFYFDDGTEDILQLPFKNPPGTCFKDLYNWKTPVEITNVTEACTIQLYIQQLIRNDASRYKEINKRPSKVAENLWLCELFRQTIIDLNFLVLELSTVCKSENPDCSKMIATTTYEFRCAAHSPPKQCSAMDYMLHTLDNVTLILNSPKVYTERNKPSKSCHRDLETLDRRLYRLFAHAFFHHKDVFVRYEKKHYLYRRFMDMTATYSLATPDQLLPKIPLTAFDN